MYNKSFKNAHEIDFAIYGNDMQFVEIELDPNESVVAEAGSMMMMNEGIEMNTILGDGSNQSNDLLSKLVGAGKRVLTGESLFMTVYTNRASGKQRVSFAAPFPGKIIPMDLSGYDGKIICQKNSFLCAAKGISVGIAFQKKLGAGFFGGEGFIMQSLEGDGLAFVNACGTVHEVELDVNEALRVDTGCLVAFTRDVDYDIQYVGGIKTMFFGGEGVFFARLKGPGKVWVQSLPFSRLAERIYQAAPQVNGSSRQGEGSALDMLGGLGNLIDGK
ncbi:MAG TPA: TIGR00266 family protein [Candidatus Gastranaerophilales bacterium]|nr:TIGR00266 family protein [Candidatus Gastranaerophilales bacterium]